MVELKHRHTLVYQVPLSNSSTQGYDVGVGTSLAAGLSY